MIRTMFFDAGEVLVHIPPWRGRLARALAGLGLRVDDERLDQALAAGQRWLDGRPHQDLIRDYAAEERHALGHLEVVARSLGVQGLDVRYLRDTCYYIAAAQAFADAAPAVRAVRAMGLSTGVISNAPPSLRALLVRLELAPLFDTITLSSDVGVMKPGAGVYTAALERAGVAAGEAGFADDGPENIDTARALGFARTWVIDRDGHAAQRPDRLGDLSQVPALLAAGEVAARVGEPSADA